MTKDEEVTLAKAHGDLYLGQHILKAKEKKAARVRDRIAARRELTDLASDLWVNLRVITRCDWKAVAKTARRIAYLAEGFDAEEQVPNARAHVEKKQRVWDAVKPR